MQPSLHSNTIEPWQEEILKGVASGRELKLLMAGRGVGKSTLSKVAMQRLWDDINRRPIEDLILNEGRIYGAKYYTVEPVGGQWFEMEMWCLDVFGPPGDIWGEIKALTPEPLQRWYMNDRKFWFRREKDRTMFILRWSSQ